MFTKYILNADDYGPVEFINKGIREQVSKGNINSVQILANFDLETLKDRMQLLADAVPENKVLDIGAHLTLTSGSPLFTFPGSKEKESWGRMVKQIESKFYFKKYTRFYYGFDRAQDSKRYKEAIRNEFRCQIERIGTLADEINEQHGRTILQLSSISNHHNIFTTKKALFELYISSNKYKSKTLRIRSPKSQPFSISDRFIKLLPEISDGESRKDEIEMDLLNRAFKQNKYPGKELKIVSPDYLDIQLYRQLGSVLGVTINKSKKLLNAKADLHQMIERSLQFSPDELDTDFKKIVEFVFHIGSGHPKDSEFGDVLEGYLGIQDKYFDDRLIEYASLEYLAKKFKKIVENQTGWNECKTIAFAKA